MKNLVYILFFFPFVVFAQESNDYPKDTSFNVRSAYRKIIKEYPHATLVKEFKISDVNEKRNLVYHKFGDRDLHIDVFYPKKNKEKLVPGVLLIHGGGWASGTKSHLVPMAQKLAEAGYVAATVEYRLSPEAHYPAGVIDLKTAVKWLKINYGNFGLDTSKVAILGTSAGATLASLVGTTSGNKKFPSHKLNKSVSDKVHAILNIDGVVDFTDPNESGKDKNPDKPSAGARWFGATYKQSPELWQEASPVNYVGKGSPPTLFVNSSLPRFHAGRDYYLKALKKCDIYFEVHTIENTPHPFWLCYPWFDEAFDHVSTFLNKVFS